MIDCNCKPFECEGCGIECDSEIPHSMDYLSCLECLEDMRKKAIRKLDNPRIDGYDSHNLECMIDAIDDAILTACDHE